MQIARQAQQDIRILSGTRTYAEQDALYRHGRYGDPHPRITNARGGQSNHNFGLAWDIGIFDENGNYIGRDAPYRAFAAIVLPKMPSLEWGGNWVSFKDYPHYQLKAVSTSETVVRELFEHGNVYA